MVNLAQLFDFLVFILEHSMLSYQIQTENDKYVVHDTDTANQVNHFQNFIAKVSKIM